MAGSDAYDKLAAYILKSTMASFAVPPNLITTARTDSVSNGGIRSTGMEGFSEQGAPQEWDMAVGEVYGYRWWSLPVPASLVGYGYDAAAEYEEGAGLFPVPRLAGANAVQWTDGRNQAVCTAGRYSFSPGRLPEHFPPETREPCGCGFWAYFDKELDVSRVLGGFGSSNPKVSSGYSASLPVFGVIKGTGRVIIGTKGFRSQYAEIVGLCVSDRAKEHLSWEIERQVLSHYDPFSREALRAAPLGQGPQVYYSAWRDRGGGIEVVRQASDADRLTRIATVEAMLSDAYPRAKVMCDQESLTRYFPPDKNYGQP